MANLEGFDANEVAPNEDFSPIPAGEYLSMLIDSEMKETKKGDGEYLELTWEILDGDYKSRRLWDRLNLKNPNEKAVKIARGTLSAICHATNVMRPKDSSEFNGIPVLIKVVVEERPDKPGEFKNEIKGYSSPDGKKATKADKQVEKPASGKASPPWKK